MHYTYHMAYAITCNSLCFDPSISYFLWPNQVQAVKVRLKISKRSTNANS